MFLELSSPYCRKKQSHQQIKIISLCKSVIIKCVTAVLCLNNASYKPLVGSRWGMDVTEWGRQQMVAGRLLSFPPTETTAPVGVCAGSPGLAGSHYMMAPKTDTDSVD